MLCRAWFLTMGIVASLALSFCGFDDDNDKVSASAEQTALTIGNHELKVGKTQTVKVTLKKGDNAIASAEISGTMTCGDHQAETTATTAEDGSATLLFTFKVELSNDATCSVEASHTSEGGKEITKKGTEVRYEKGLHVGIEPYAPIAGTAVEIIVIAIGKAGDKVSISVDKCGVENGEALLAKTEVPITNGKASVTIAKDKIVETSGDNMCTITAIATVGGEELTKTHEFRVAALKNETALSISITPSEPADGEAVTIAVKVTGEVDNNTVNIAVNNCGAGDDLLTATSMQITNGWAHATTAAVRETSGDNKCVVTVTATVNGQSMPGGSYEFTVSAARPLIAYTLAITDPAEDSTSTEGTLPDKVKITATAGEGGEVKLDSGVQVSLTLQCGSEAEQSIGTGTLSAVSEGDHQFEVEIQRDGGTLNNNSRCIITACAPVGVGTGEQAQTRTSACSDPRVIRSQEEDAS